MPGFPSMVCDFQSFVFHFQETSNPGPASSHCWQGDALHMYLHLQESCVHHLQQETYGDAPSCSKYSRKAQWLLLNLFPLMPGSKNRRSNSSVSLKGGCCPLTSSASPICCVGWREKLGIICRSFSYRKQTCKKEFWPMGRGKREVPACGSVLTKAALCLHSTMHLQPRWPLRAAFGRRLNQSLKTAAGFQSMGSRHGLPASVSSLFLQLCVCKTARAGLLTIDSIAPSLRSDAYSQAVVKSFIMNFHQTGLQSDQLPWPQYLSEHFLLADTELKPWRDGRSLPWLSPWWVRFCQLFLPIGCTSALSSGCTIPFVSRDRSFSETLNSGTGLCLMEDPEGKKLILWVTLSSSFPVSNFAVSS